MWGSSPYLANSLHLRGGESWEGAEGYMNLPPGPVSGVSFLVVISYDSRKALSLLEHLLCAISVPHEHSAEMETEAQRGQVTCPEPHSSRAKRVMQCATS